MSKKVHGRRALLNSRGYESTSAIAAEIEDTARWKPGCDIRGKPIDKWVPEPNYVLQIANCDRSIAFALGFEDAADRRNSLRKIDTLIDCLTKFREGLVIEQARYAERVEQLEGDADE